MSGVDAREDIVRYSYLIYQKGWAANHEGNLTVRYANGRFLSTPTAFSKGDVRERDLIEVDAERNVVRGFRRPFSEFSLHLAAYAARPDVVAVIHAHPPAATAMSVIGRGLMRPIIAESVVSLGPVVPCSAFFLPGSSDESATVSQMAQRFDVFFLGNHGVLALGDSLEQAFLRLEYAEHLADIEARAIRIGEPRYLTWQQIQPLLDKRKSAGLGPEARGMSRDAAYGEFAGQMS
ncbi:MAG: class II aldolase/adducin family protein [bacterium]